ncbi:hypothetical protein MP638_005683 [Amoeboaphelidium occidentale]|nr:hypothetical protein MP638_005683 [Amoeboaphelidium occidentale]
MDKITGSFQQEQSDAMKNEVMMAAIMESCPAKGVMATVGGFVFGGAFGLIMTSFEASSTAQAAIQISETGKAPPLRQQLKDTARDMGKRSYSMAKSFAVIGAIYSTTECVIESYRAKHDIYNSVSAGCVSGALLAIRSGPQGAAFGCAGFAAFSAAIDYFMEGR